MRKFGLLLVAGVLVAFVWEVAKSQPPSPRTPAPTGKLQDPDGPPLDPKIVAGTNAAVQFLGQLAEKGTADKESGRRPNADDRFPSSEAADDEDAKLVALKKRLPDMLEAWQKEHSPANIGRYKPSIRLLRSISQTEAKLTIVWEYREIDNQVRHPAWDTIVTAHLRYFGGSWTTMTWDKSSGWDNSSGPATQEDRFLILAIDEAGGK